MKRVQSVFHFFNFHFSTHGQDPPKKRAKNPMAMGIVKFNLGFKVACTSKRHKAMGDNVFFFFFFQFCHVIKGGNHSKDNLVLVIKKPENKNFEAFFCIF
jgi:hypothetical protein